MKYNHTVENYPVFKRNEVDPDVVKISHKLFMKKL